MNDSADAAPQSESSRLLIPADASGQRLDRWLTSQFPQRSRSEIQRWIRDGRVRVDDNVAKPGQRLEAQQRVLVDAPPESTPTELHAEPIPLAILYEDENVLVIDKPAGMVVHPAPGHESGTLVHAILHHCPQIEGVGGVQRPGIVHRLDKETSGLLIVAKNDAAQRALQAQFQARTVYKEYLALVEGVLEPPRGRISVPIGRHPAHRQRMAVIPQSSSARARDAVTDYEVIARYSTPVKHNANVANFSLARVILHTGRTHQIRVHFAWYKHPVVGDTLYGYRRQRLALDRQFLHAHRLRIQLPGATEKSEFVAPLPPELQTVLDQLAGPDDIG